MEIIHLILGKANPERMNGVNRVVHELATRQHDAGLRVSVWGIAADEQHNYPERRFTTKLFAQPKNKFRIPPALLRLIDTLPGHAIFHLHGGWVPQMYALGKALHQRQRPFVFTPHGAYNTIAMQRSNVRKKLYRILLERYLLQRAAAIHVLGKSEVEGLNAWYPNSKTRIIPYGFESMGHGSLVMGHEKERPTTHDLQHTTHDSRPTTNAAPFIISFCGRIDIYTKGLDALADGFALFYKQHPQSRLWIIGDGGERTALEQRVAALSIEEAVVFHGAKFGEEKIALLRQSHVFAHPSRNEGLPASILEAAALGIPCLVTEATNVGDAVRDASAGYVMEATDKHQVQAGLETLYPLAWSAEVRRLYGEAAMRMIAQHYHWDVLLQQFTRLYQSVLSQAYQPS